MPRSNYDPHKASVIKRLNERQAEIRRQFGEDSSIYRDYHNTLLVTFGPENINESGNVKRGPATYDILTDSVMSALLRHQTAGQIKAAARREAKEQSELTGETITMEDVIAARESVDEIIEEKPDDFYEAVTFYWDSVGGKGHPRPTYTQIDDIYQTQETIRRGMDDNPFITKADTRYTMDKLRKRLKATDEARQAGMLASYFE